MKSNTLHLFLAIFIAAILFSCHSTSNNSENNITDIDETTTADIFYEIDEPFDNVQIDYETLTILDPTVAFTLTTTSGATLAIPPNAFVDATTGQPITTPVNIQWREFHDAADIITSGIPMKVNDNGTEAWMQTAGMFDIKGFSQDKTIKIAPNKSLNVHFISQQPGTYDAWLFDKSTGNWVNQGTSEATPLSVDKTALAEEIATLEQQTKRRPQPVTNPKNHIRFTDLNVDCCPGLQNKNSIVLEKLDGAVKIPKNENWVEKTLKQTTVKEVYELKLYGKTEVYTLKVKMPLQGADLKAANARYAALMATYNANLASLKQKRALSFQQETFRRTLAVSSFNVYNYDILWKKNFVPIYANFDCGPMPETLANALRVYLITGEGRTVVDFPKQDWRKFRFDPNSDNRLIAILPQNKIAFFTANDFVDAKDELIAAEGTEFTFDMKIAEEEIMTVDDLRDVIDKVSI